MNKQFTKGWLNRKSSKERSKSIQGKNIDSWQFMIKKVF